VTWAGVVVGEVLPDLGDAGAGVCLGHRVDAGVQAVQDCRVTWNLFRGGGSAEASALTMVRRPTW
jgi:hypothetical protein